MAKILVVEDNEMNWDIMSIHLKRQGHKAIRASHGKQGLEMAATELPDLIIMDMTMPIMNGWEASRKLKDQPTTKHIPIIAVTGHTGKEEKEKIKVAGCDDYIIKPVDYPAMMEKVTAMLEKKAP